MLYNSYYMKGSWAEKAGKIIWDIVCQCKNENKTYKETCKIISDSYPFGRKENLPYKSWLKARKEILDKIFPEERGNNEKI